MQNTTAKTPEEYIADLPQDRQEQLQHVRDIILKNLPDGFEEGINWGMITYCVPLATYPDTYNGEPLLYAALASQKNHMAVYLMGVYSDEKQRTAFEQAYAATGKRMDIGKSCVRFRSLDDLPLELIGKSIAAFDVDTYIKTAVAARERGLGSGNHKKKKT